MTIPLDPVLLRLGPLQLGWHGLFTALGVLAGLWLAGRLVRRWAVPEEDFGVVAFWAIGGGVVGARLLHVVDNWETYAADPLRILLVNEGGIAVYGALLGGSAAAALHARRIGLPLGRLADAGGLGFLLGQAVGRLGDLVNGEHRALPTDLPWGVRYTHPNSPGQVEAVHPVVAYEALWELLVLGALLRWGDRLPAPGMRYWACLALYGVGRFTLGFLRIERSWLWNLGQAQLVALGTVGAAVVMLVWLARRAGQPTDAGQLRARATARPDPAAERLRRAAQQARREAAGAGTLVAVGGGFLGYFGAELALAVYPHPVHWATALTVGALGYGGGWGWSTRRWRRGGR